MAGLVLDVASDAGACRGLVPWRSQWLAQAQVPCPRARGVGWTRAYGARSLRLTASRPRVES